ncbi:hypothetical protein [Nocardia brasiliensis]|uniref:nuclear transport factor 2 family protein n=1 Tax=Nocardia brasiliensis TaxID=37326 RepID=UPI00366BF1D4
MSADSPADRPEPRSETAAAQQNTPASGGAAADIARGGAADPTAGAKAETHASTEDAPAKRAAEGVLPSAPAASEAATEAIERGDRNQPGSAATSKSAPGASAPPEKTTPATDVDGDAPTTVMRVQRPAPPVENAGPEADTVKMPTKAPGTAPDAGRQPPPGSEDVTVAMPVIKPDDAQTVALPIQRPADAPKPAGTDRVVPGAGRVPITKPPSTPRPAPGPKQPGQQGPSAPPQSGPAPVEETRPAPPRPPMPRQMASAPSPADVQPTLPAQTLGGPRPPQPRPIAQPQRITPAQAPSGPAATGSGRSKKWLLALAGAAVLVVVLIGVAVAVVVNSTNNSPEAQVRAAITDYTQALQSGDLTALRDTTCGPLHDFYQGIPADQFAGVHQLSMERRNIPVVDGVDAIRITDDTAIAQATVYTEADPSKRSARTFDLQRTDNGWKVCDPPTSTP